MAAVTITVEGIPEVAKAFDDLPLHMRSKILTPIYEDAAKIALSQIQTRVPRRSGRTAAEIRAVTTQVFGEPAVVIRPDYKRVRTTHLPEFGTRPHGGHPGTRAQRFFNSSIDETQQAVLEHVEKKATEAIDAYWSNKGLDK